VGALQRILFLRDAMAMHLTESIANLLTNCYATNVIPVCF